MLSNRDTDVISSIKTHAGQPLFWWIGCIFFALMQLLWAGYRLGVGNQSIQIAFAWKLHDPSLYRRDVMVGQTLDSYPSYFYHAVAWLLNFADLPQLYLILQLLTAVAALAAAAWLCKAMFRQVDANAEAVRFQSYGSPGSPGSLGPVAALLLIAMLLAGRHMTLGGDGLYSAGFSHTWAAFAVGLTVLTLFYADRYFFAFLLAGLLFNIHALEAAYLGWFMGLATLLMIRRIGYRRVLGSWAIYALAAGPTLAMMFLRHQDFTDVWMRLMHARSAAHSFPSSWWEVGNPDVPRFLLMVSMGALGMSLVPHGPQWRKTQWVGVAAGLLFAIGYLFTEVWPQTLVVRAQLYRCSRFVEVIALAYVAAGCVAAWRMAMKRPDDVASDEPASNEAVGFKPYGRYGLWCEVLVMSTAVACLSLPTLMALLPWVVLLAAIVALWNGRLSWYAAIIVSGSLLTCLLAHQQLHFVIPGLSADFSWRMLTDLQLPGIAALAAGAFGVMMWLTSLRKLAWPQIAVVALIGVTAATSLTFAAWPGLLAAPSGGEAMWIDAQRWARDNTAADALFLTPPQTGGFRVYSQRAVVGEWRDGTQLYFSADFAEPWWDRMKTLQQGLLYNSTGTRMLQRGRPLDELDDEQLMAMAKTYHADYVVLPAGKMHWMQRVYANDRWEIYRPHIPVLAPGAEAQAAQARFVAQVAQRSIRENRTSDTRVQVLDDKGRPLADATYRIEQLNSSFGFGATLPPFVASPDDLREGDDLQRGIVNEAQQAAFSKLFNFTVTGLTGTWLQTENQRGRPWFDDTDAYLNWCDKHHVPVELHCLCGYEPVWLTQLKPNEQLAERIRHVREMIARYGSHITYWEVTDDGIGAENAAMLFSIIRKELPEAKLGIAACTRFASDAPPAMRQRDMWRGLDEIRTLKQKGVTVDFVSFHAHRPWGYWPDARMIYQTLDAFAKEGVRVHISQLAQPISGPIGGTVHDGQWSPARQAAFYREFFTICFSHPAVDAINLESLGPDGLTAGGGVIDANGRPTPAYTALEQLILHDWRTNLSGKLGLDGAVRFRGFHGDYRLTLTTADGHKITTPFTVKAGDDNAYRFVFDAAKQKLEARP